MYVEDILIGRRIVLNSIDIQIRLMAEKIKEKFHHEKIFLFGSYAYSEPKSHSDIDLLIIMNTQLSSHKQAVLTRLMLD